MNNKNFLIERIIQNKIIAIIRQIYGDDLLFLVETLLRANINILEITFDQNDPKHMAKTTESIRLIHKSFQDCCACGAGTVLNCSQVDAAFSAGAQFMIAPNFNRTVVDYANRLGMVTVPGCMTPSEIQSASESCADFIKLFPSIALGPSYVKNVLSPLNHVRLLAVGGINLKNFESFLSAGCCGAGIGGALCNRSLINTRDRTKLQFIASEFVRIASGNTPQ